MLEGFHSIWVHYVQQRKQTVPKSFRHTHNIQILDLNSKFNCSSMWLDNIVVLFQAFIILKHSVECRIHKLTVSASVCPLLHRDMAIMHQLQPDQSMFQVSLGLTGNCSLSEKKKIFLKLIYGENIQDGGAEIMRRRKTNKWKL